MAEKQENFDGKSFAVKDFIEKVKDRIPFVKKSDLQKEEPEKAESQAIIQHEVKAPAKLKEFAMRPAVQDPYKEFMEKEGYAKAEERRRKKLEDAEKALTDFETKYSEKLGNSDDPKDRAAYKFKLNLLKEDLAFIRKHFDLL